MKLFLDMDGVLVDLVGSVEEYFDRCATFEKGQYDLAAAMGMTDLQLWPYLDESFWANARKSCRAEDLVDITGDVYIVTSPTLTPGCWSGKMLWVARHFPRIITERRLIFCSHKEMLARPDILLVDDCDSHVDKFLAAGGQAIVWPQQWNTSEESPWDCLDRIFDTIRERTDETEMLAGRS